MKQDEISTERLNLEDWLLCKEILDLDPFIKENAIGIMSILSLLSNEYFFEGTEIEHTVKKLYDIVTGESKDYKNIFVMAINYGIFRRAIQLHNPELAELKGISLEKNYLLELFFEIR